MIEYVPVFLSSPHPATHVGRRSRHDMLRVRSPRGQRSAHGTGGVLPAARHAGRAAPLGPSVGASSRALLVALRRRGRRAGIRALRCRSVSILLAFGKCQSQNYSPL